MYVEIGKRVRVNSELVINGRVRVEDNIQIVLNNVMELQSVHLTGRIVPICGIIFAI